jgi:translation elongation factor EF-1alpha
MRRFHIIDNPGHRDFTKNATFGIFHADVCVLVTSAVMSEIEISELSAGQAMDHLLTAFCFGVRHVVVAVNKMDKVDFSQAEFERVRMHTLALVKKAGFKEANILFVPISVLENDGITNFSPRLSWFTGNSLIQTLDEVHLPARQVDQPFKLVSSEVFKNKGGVVVCGKVDRGMVSVGDKVTASNGFNGVVKGIRSIGTLESENAVAGDDVGIFLWPTTVAEPKNTSSSAAAAGAGKGRSQAVKAKAPKLGSTPVKRGEILFLATQQPSQQITHFEVQMFVGE